MKEISLSSKELLKGVLKPHSDLAIDLMNLIKSNSSNDPTYHIQIAAVMIFLAGVDKTLSLTFELLYLAGEISWKWMNPNKKMKPPAGFIECQRGLTAKVIKLQELGVDISHLQWLTNLRNEYVHSCSIYAGYTVRLENDSDEIQVKTFEPTVSFPLSPMTALQAKNIQAYSEHILDLLGCFIDKTEWKEKWIRVTNKLKELPENPEPEFSQIIESPEKEFEILNKLNKIFIGDGLKNLLKE